MNERNTLTRLQRKHLRLARWKQDLFWVGGERQDTFEDCCSLPLDGGWDVVPAWNLGKRNGRWMLQVKCPWCMLHHYHDAGDRCAPTYYGGRIAPCRGTSIYFLVDPPISYRPDLTSEVPLPSVRVRAQCHEYLGRRIWSLTVRECPFCSMRHVHGGGEWSKRPDYGDVRTSHCIGDDEIGSYILVPDGRGDFTTPTPQWLYRLYDNKGRLLYIGITNSVLRRVKQHQHDHAWVPDIAGVQWQPYPSREAVLAAEKRAIRAEKPVYNIQHAGY